MCPTACRKSAVTPGDRRYDFSGSVKLTGILRNVEGETIGTREVRDADSVRVYLFRNGILDDSTKTIDGTYHFPDLENGRYAAVVRVASTVSDSTEIVLSGADRTTLDTLTVGTFGDLHGSPNPFDFIVAIDFGLVDTSPINLRVVDPAGNTRRQLLSGNFPGGRHIFTWDGRSDTEDPVPPGAYWVVFQQADDERALLLFRE